MVVLELQVGQFEFVEWTPGWAPAVLRDPHRYRDPSLDGPANLAGHEADGHADALQELDEADRYQEDCRNFTATSTLWPYATRHSARVATDSRSLTSGLMLSSRIPTLSKSTL
jgi:hypothetical protein